MQTMNFTFQSKALTRLHWFTGVILGFDDYCSQHIAENVAVDKNTH